VGSSVLADGYFCRRQDRGNPGGGIGGVGFQCHRTRVPPIEAQSPCRSRRQGWGCLIHFDFSLEQGFPAGVIGGHKFKRVRSIGGYGDFIPHLPAGCTFADLNVHQARNGICPGCGQCGCTGVPAVCSHCPRRGNRQGGVCQVHADLAIGGGQIAGVVLDAKIEAVDAFFAQGEAAVLPGTAVGANLRQQDARGGIRAADADLNRVDVPAIQPISHRIGGGQGRGSGVQLDGLLRLCAPAGVVPGLRLNRMAAVGRQYQGGGGLPRLPGPAHLHTLHTGNQVGGVGRDRHRRNIPAGQARGAGVVQDQGGIRQVNQERHHAGIGGVAGVILGAKFKIYRPLTVHEQAVILPGAADRAPLGEGQAGGQVRPGDVHRERGDMPVIVTVRRRIKRLQRWEHRVHLERFRWGNG